MRKRNRSHEYIFKKNRDHESNKIIMSEES